MQYIEMHFCTSMLQSSNIAHAAYDSLWYNQKISLWKSLLYVVLRCHKPVILSVPCMLPTFSLNYYASVSYRTYSVSYSLSIIRFG